ncbi:uncharacterized protein LOC125776457 [Bactrocera dorsalis]|uniref:Uncharacterized protein LOC125776457 n=1 Tax=Bactrocera dorsalis TaxID=27457 RepID=A0ABM3J536_BACDO|nr:uncharacterized protein LOC125776457 [Bactrocera dorsalis]
MDDEELFSGDDFSSDDIFKDVTYTPPRKTSKRKVFEDGPPVKKACIEAAYLNKTIFHLEEINADEETTTSQSLGYSKVELESIIREQLYSYLADAIKNCAVWQKYDLLKQASLYFNTPLTSSAPVERLFSFAGIIIAPEEML